MASEPIVDLTDERAQAEAIAQGILGEQVGPWIARELREKWPRRTGRSADAWVYSGGNLSNNVDYTESVATRDGPAMETVLKPVSTEAASRRWME